MIILRYYIVSSHYYRFRCRHERAHYAMSRRRYAAAYTGAGFDAAPCHAMLPLCLLRRHTPLLRCRLICFFHYRLAPGESRVADDYTMSMRASAYMARVPLTSAKIRAARLMR